MAGGKPFIKWVGGKGQLVEQLEALLPGDFASWKNVTYIEPFIGGGAMLFHTLRTRPNVTSAVINDINANLTDCYKVVRDRPAELLDALEQLQREYDALKSEETRRVYYLDKRARYNAGASDVVAKSALFIFLNRTCFNGLYRVNKKGLFNVPFGKYKNPTICDRNTILCDSKLLQNVEIMTGDFEATVARVGGKTFFYFDPPYRPLSPTSDFNDYSKEGFDDNDQIRLKKFCDKITGLGCAFLLSNSDCLAKNDRFFEDLYADYTINRVLATRNVNSQASKRGKLSELVVSNYQTSCGEYMLDLQGGSL